jgi:hypothetical protein
MASEALRLATRRLREILDRIESDTSDAQDLLGEIEEEAGLVREDGSRIDETPK